VYSIAFEPIHAVGLAIRPDPDKPMVHALVEPAHAMGLEEYRASIAGTRSGWTKAWP
jgi:hypothetical protein